MSILSLCELEETLKNAGPHKRHETLHAVADMFLCDPRNLDRERIELFDEVLGLLINGSDRPEIAALSRRMAPVENAPPRLIKKLARDTDIDVAAPVLTQSPCLTTDDLCEIAGSRGNSHLLAISGRSGLQEPVTDILVTRGDQDVARTVAHNDTARLSAAGVERLLERAETDEALGRRVRERGDIPPELVQSALSKIAERAAERSRRIAAAQHAILGLKRSGVLDGARVMELAKEDKYEEVVAAVAVLSDVKYELIENMMHPQRIGGIVLVCKSIGLVWAVVHAVLQLAVRRNGLTETELKQAHREFLGVSRSAADRVIRFWRVRQSVAAVGSA